MLRIARLTDYGMVLLTQMARHPERDVFTARDLAGETRLPLPTASKVLKLLAHGGLLVSTRGVAGGYRLAKPAQEISVAAIIAAIEGPIALTLCAQGSGSCEMEGWCAEKGQWGRINKAIVDALEGVSLSEMSKPSAGPPAGFAAPISFVELRSKAQAKGGPTAW
ncbi:MAG: SUF system Fe-S cluster assembly regulator [Thermoplasmatota archaeon]